MKYLLHFPYTSLPTHTHQEKKKKGNEPTPCYNNYIIYEYTCKGQSVSLYLIHWLINPPISV